MDFKMIHTCVRVLDLARAEAFYRHAFGFEVARRLDFPEGGFTLSYLRAPGAGFELELTWNHDRTEPYVHGDGYSHLAVAVDDLEAAHRRHREQGYAPGDPKGLPGGPPRFYFLTDPDGYQIEVVRGETSSPS